MRVGSLFSGIGGFDLGFTVAGFDIAWQVELDPYCRAVLAKHWPDVPRYNDIREVDSTTLQPVDVIVGGFPCQDLSMANAKGQGLDGKNSGLWWEMLRVVSELRPRYVVVENVSRLVNGGLDRLCGSLAEIGYSSEWNIISGADVGAPHTRSRTWIISYPNRIAGPEYNSKPQGGIEDRIGANTIRHGLLGGWEAEPPPIRISDGVSNRVDRLRGLGNSCIPHITATIAQLIKEREESNHMKIIIEVNIDTRIVTNEDEDGNKVSNKEIVLLPIVEANLQEEDTSTSTSNLDQDTSTNLELRTTSSELPKPPIVTKNGSSPFCKKAGCNTEVKRGGYCHKHYMTEYRKSYSPSIEADMLHIQWKKHPELDYKAKYKMAWCKVFDDLHRIDKLEWGEIREISDFALKSWVPRFMQSPTKFRQPSKAYPEKKCYEIMQGQMKGEITDDASDASAFVDDLDFQ